MIKRMWVLLAVSFVLAASTVFLPVRVESAGELWGVVYGWPLGFLRQYMVMDVPDFPYWARVASPWEWRAEVLVGRFLGDVVIVWGCLMVIGKIGGKVMKREEG